ncbi:MAG: phytoene desaturase, partial [Armatimonadetes bacterium]|nr:phytoene desaturase [Armatimonadota bacterium]
QTGGRARDWHKDGFAFDLGPSWYWMPDVFEQFFARFGKSPADYYDLHRLDPGYRVVFGEGNAVDIPADLGELADLFESIEPGSAAKLRTFLAQAEYKYRVGMNDYVRRPSLSVTEFVDIRIVKESVRLQMVQTMRSHVQSFFKDERLRRILEFPILFLGGTGREIPAMYSLMNYADLVLGTWYPMGGLRKVADAMESLARELGVQIITDCEASKIVVEHGAAVGVETMAGETHRADSVIAGADYHHVEQNLLEPQYRTYDEAYWDSRVLSPSSLLFYLGVDKRLQNLQHHNLFFDEPLDPHADVIFKNPAYPDKPLFYVCCPSQTDPGVAPPGCENIFVLIPLAPGLSDTDAERERQYDLVMTRLERLTGQTIRESVIVRRDYAHRDFIADYHSYKGNAYGLANTLAQTAFWKPTLKPLKVRNLFYCGQLTVPGPGVPPSLISGQIAADLALGVK